MEGNGGTPYLLGAASDETPGGIKGSENQLNAGGAAGGQFDGAMWARMKTRPFSLLDGQKDPSAESVQSPYFSVHLASNDAETHVFCQPAVVFHPRIRLWKWNPTNSQGLRFSTM